MVEITYDLEKSQKEYFKNLQLNLLTMKITCNQWVEIIRAISTAIIAIITTLCVQSCTMSLSISKNNSNSNQKTEQTTTSSVDSTHININPKSH